jgi:hypothetical protein
MRILMTITAASLSLLLLAPARAEISNWLLGGRWVIECAPQAHTRRRFL